MNNECRTAEQNPEAADSQPGHVGGDPESFETSPFNLRRSIILIVLAFCGLAGTAVFLTNAANERRFPDLDFDDPPAGYEKEILPADEQHRISVGSLDFQLSDVVRTKDGAIEASIGLDHGFEIIAFRLFDHSTRKLIHDSRWELNTDSDAPKYRVSRLGETDRIRIEELTGQLPETIDLWLRLVESRRGKIIRIPAKEGATVPVGTSSIVVTSLFSGSANGKTDATGRMSWDLATGSNESWQTTLSLQNQGSVLKDWYHVVAVTMDGRRHAMDHKAFVQFAIHRSHHDYVKLDVALNRIDHFELIPFRDRHKFFFDAVKVPERSPVAKTEGFRREQ